MKIVKTILEKLSFITGFFGILSSGGAIDSDVSIIPALVVLLISALLGFTVWEMGRYEAWKKAESNRLNNRNNRYHNASRLASM